MSNKKLEALKALFKKEKENKKSGGSGKRGDMYPFWNMNMNEKAVVRILPDKNPENPFMFYVEKLEHKISINGKNEKIPCLQMYGEKCPICELSRDYYKSEGKASANGKYYYRTKSSLVRVLVISDPLPPDEETGENANGKVLNTQFGYQLMEKIKEEIGSDELEDVPWDMRTGYNFNIKKTPQGTDYGTYAVGSGFAKKQTSIDPDLIDEIELIDLQTLLPKNPGYETVKRKLEAHLNGTDVEEGDEQDEDEDEDDTPIRKQTRTRKPVVVEEEDEDSEDQEETVIRKKSTSKPVATQEDDEDDADDIIAQIRRKRQS